MGSNIEGEEDNKITIGVFIALLISFIFQELYYLSPLYFIFKYNTKRIEMKNIPFFQICFNTLTCVCILLEAIKGIGDFQNFITNIIGLFFSLIVIYQLWLSLTKEKASEYLLYLFAIFNIIFQIFYYVLKSHEENGKEDLLITILNQLPNVAMYLFCNQNDYFAYKEKKSEKIPILSCVLGLICTITWIIYHIFKNKGVFTFYNIIANALGAFCLVIAIVEYIFIKFKYERKVVVNEKKDDKNIEFIESINNGSQLVPNIEPN